MNRPVIVDTGPLVAGLDKRDRYHAWALSQFQGLPAPLLTCESVLSEAHFLLRDVPHSSQAIMALIDKSALQVCFQFDQEKNAVGALLARYANVPMSFADACLVRMAELYPHGAVMTLDSDFKIYRKNGRQVIPTIMPPKD